MLTFETEARLAEIFSKIAEYEKEVEECRWLLSKSSDFDPMSTFKALDRLGLGSLSSSEVQSVLDRFHFFCSNNEAYLVVRQYDNNLDGRLAAEEFNQFVLPSTNPSLREVALCRRGSFTPEVEYLFIKLLQTEVMFHRNIEAVRREILLRPDFNLLEAFRSVDFRNASFIDRGSLMTFMRKHRQVFEEDVDAVLRRVDNDGDELISYLEFVDCVMPSRTVVKERQSSPSRNYRQSSPLRNASGTQFSFRNSSPLRSPKREPVAAMSQSVAYLKSSSISSPKRSSPLRRSPLKSPPRNPDLSSSVRVEHRDFAVNSFSNTYSSPQKQSNNSVPLRQSGRNSSPLRQSGYNTSPFKQSGHSPSQARQSPPRQLGRQSSPLRSTTLNNSPSRNYETGDFNKTVDYRSSYNRASSPLRRSSPDRNLTTEPRSSSYFRPLQSLEEKELVASFHEEIKISREIESAKNVLALKHDFNLIDAFRIFDVHDIGMVSVNDIEAALSHCGFQVTRDEIYLLVKHYSRLQDGRLRFSDFSEIFTPRQEEYSRILRSRSGINIVGIERLKAFTKDTLNVFLGVFQKIFEAEAVAERIRQRLTRTPGFNLYSAFNALDRDRNGFITITEFQQVLHDQGLFVSPKDLQSLMEKYDKNKDGRVSYSEFIEEVTPKSPQRY